MVNKTMRDAFFDNLYRLAKRDKRIFLLSADMGAPSLDKFRKELSSQFINMGIAEQNMVTVATGLALAGKKVFIYAIMPFVTLRCYEMLKINLSLMNIPITAIGVGAGFGYNDSGPTHHSTEDIAVMRVLPNLVIFSPSDSVMAYKLASISCKEKFPIYIRLDRKVLPLIYDKRKIDFSLGFSELRKGRDLYIISTGNMVHKALEVARLLKSYSLHAGVIDLYRLKPLSRDPLLKIIKKVKRIVTLEEHLINGGLGSIIAEIIVDAKTEVFLKRIAIPDRYYYAYGEREDILRVCGLDTSTVVRKILNWINEKE